MKAVFTLLSALFVFGLQAQGTLQFNRVLLLDNSMSSYTVPAGKVWKIEQVSSVRGRYAYAYSQNYTSNSWSTSSPNPCTGSPSGTSNVDRVLYTDCPTFGQVQINGYAYTFDSSSPVWLPAGSVVTVPGSSCVHQVNVTIAAVPYYTNLWGSNIYICGPVNLASGTTVPNSNLVSIIEFNVVP